MVPTKGKAWTHPSHLDKTRNGMRLRQFVALQQYGGNHLLITLKNYLPAAIYGGPFCCSQENGILPTTIVADVKSEEHY